MDHPTISLGGIWNLDPDNTQTMFKNCKGFFCGPSVDSTRQQRVTHLYFGDDCLQEIYKIRQRKKKTTTCELSVIPLIVFYIIRPSWHTLGFEPKAQNCKLGVAPLDPMDSLTNPGPPM